MMLEDGLQMMEDDHQKMDDNNVKTKSGQSDNVDK